MAVTEDSGWEIPGGSEVVTICGDDDDRALLPAAGPVLGGSLTATSGAHIDPVRVLLWTLTGALVLCVVVLMLARWRESQAQNQITAPDSTSYPMQIVFGDRGTNVGSPYGPNGIQSACTDETYDSGSGSWNCVDWSIDRSGLPIAAAAQPDVACTAEQRVDQATGHWVCVQG